MATLVSFPPPRLAALWSTLSEPLRTIFAVHGITSAAVFRNLFRGSLQEAREVSQEFGGGAGDAPVLVEVWEALAAAKAAELRRIGDMPVATMVVAAEAVGKKRQLASLIADSPAESPADAAEHHVAAWPGRLRRDSQLEGDPRARAKAEEARRDKWVAELVMVVESLGLRVVRVAAEMRVPNALTKLLGRGRRASTIRRRVLDWHKFSRFLRMTFNTAWPTSVAHVLEYISALADFEVCGELAPDARA